MAADSFTLATELAILLAGRAPSWRSQVVSSALTAPPVAVTDGAALDSAPRTLVAVDLREDVHRRTARLTIPTLSIGDDFTVTINGGTAVYDSVGDADLDEVVAGLAAAINADADVNTIVLATAVRASDDATTVGVRDSVKIVGLTSADYTIDFTDNGTSVVACVADASTATLRLYFALATAPGVTLPDGWRKAPTSYSIDGQGFVERFDTAGLSRMFVMLSGLDGPSGDGAAVTVRTPDVRIGPAVLET